MKQKQEAENFFPQKVFVVCIFMPRLTKVSGAYRFCLVCPSVRLAVLVYVPDFLGTSPPKLEGARF